MGYGRVRRPAGGGAGEHGDAAEVGAVAVGGDGDDGGVVADGDGAPPRRGGGFGRVGQGRVPNRLQQGGVFVVEQRVGVGGVVSRPSAGGLLPEVGAAVVGARAGRAREYVFPVGGHVDRPADLFVAGVAVELGVAAAYLGGSPSAGGAGEDVDGAGVAVAGLADGDYASVSGYGDGGSEPVGVRAVRPGGELGGVGFGESAAGLGEGVSGAFVEADGSLARVGVSRADHGGIAVGAQVDRPSEVVGVAELASQHAGRGDCGRAAEAVEHAAAVEGAQAAEGAEVAVEVEGDGVALARGDCRREREVVAGEGLVRPGGGRPAGSDAEAVDRAVVGLPVNVGGSDDDPRAGDRAAAAEGGADRHVFAVRADGYGVSELCAVSGVGGG